MSHCKNLSKLVSKQFGFFYIQIPKKTHFGLDFICSQKVNISNFNKMEGRTKEWLQRHEMQSISSLTAFSWPGQCQLWVCNMGCFTFVTMFIDLLPLANKPLAITVKTVVNFVRDQIITMCHNSCTKATFSNALWLVWFVQHSLNSKETCVCDTFMILLDFNLLHNIDLKI